MLAMWFQGTDAISEINTNLLTVFIGLVALAMLVQAIALIVLAAKSVKAIKGLAETVDELKQKALPLIDSATEISRTAQSLVTETAPKVRPSPTTWWRPATWCAARRSTLKRRWPMPTGVRSARWRGWTRW